MSPSCIRSNRRILVVDDDAAIHDVFRQILSPTDGGADFGEAEPFEIHSADQGGDALKMVELAVAENRPYSVAFVDFRMPGWNGTETAKRLWDASPDLQIVICTAFADFSWETVPKDLNPKDRMLVLKKPFEIIEVIQLASTLSEKWKRLREFTAAMERLEDSARERTQELEQSRAAALNMMEDAVRSREQSEQALVELTLEIAEHRWADAALRESEQRYRNLVELSPDAICIRSEDRLVLVNQAAVTLFGASNASDLEGREFLGLVHPDSRASAEERLDRIQEPNTKLPSAEKKLLRLDGASFEAEMMVASFVFQEKPSALIVLRDVTEKKALNQKMLRNQRLESIGTLAGGIAHDLNNILAPILMSIEILRIRFPETAAEHILATIESSARRGADMVKQVLAFARGGDGEHMPLQISYLIREIARILNQTFPKTIRIRALVSKPLWAVIGDATQLHQVLMNLCVNARDAMPDGGTLTVGAKNLLIDETFAGMNPEAHAGPHTVVTVSDTGTGIPPEVRDRIFDPFFTTKPVDKGTGLGLATVRGIVKSHGGFVTLQSEMGKGTEFTLYLPAQETGATIQDEATQHALPTGKGELILVVDDEAAILNMAKQTLEAFGYQVLTAVDGAQATAVCAQNQGNIKLMVTDMMMPIMDGAATARAVRTIDPNIKIIATSGLGANGKVADLANPLADVFLHKPYTAEALVRTIHQTLGGEGAPEPAPASKIPHS